MSVFLCRVMATIRLEARTRPSPCITNRAGLVVFPALLAFASDTPSVRAALKELGKAGGLMDANDANDPTAHPNLARELTTEAALNAESEQSEADGRHDVPGAVPGP